MKGGETVGAVKNDFIARGYFDDPEPDDFLAETPTEEIWSPQPAGVNELIPF